MDFAKDFQVAQALHPIATMVIGCLHGVTSFVDGIQQYKPTPKAQIALYMSLANIFTRIGGDFRTRAMEIPGFSEVMDELTGTNKAVPSSSDDVSNKDESSSSGNTKGVA